MTKIWMIFLILLMSSISEAGISVCQDINGNITKFQLRGGQISGCLWFDAGQNVLQTEYDHVKDLLETIPRKYLKAVSGTVQEKNAVEKAQVDAAELTASQILESQAVDKLEISNEDIITALVQVINVRLPSNKITKQEIIMQIKTNKGL